MTTVVQIDLTPTRKRKRAPEKPETNTNVCFTNLAFSSTPKKITGRRRTTLNAIKENLAPYSNNACMEVKSIAELVKDQKEHGETEIINPFEIQRKPPKKKKREATIEGACFENPALNLNLPEKRFNPFEVMRNVDNGVEEKRKCFVNEALNIKGDDSDLHVRNPFEIKRHSTITEVLGKKKTVGVENPALDEIAVPTNLKLGIPFTPTVGCRIDFNNVSLSQLTPNKLLLGEKLVFSPVPPIIKPKRSLDAISEESSSTSIGKELDRYQLELENSINEAKLRKNDSMHCSRIEEERVFQLQVKLEKRTSLTQRLTDIPENEEYENEESEQVQNSQNDEVQDKNEMTVNIEKLSDKVVKESTQVTVTNLVAPMKEQDFEYDSEEENFDFKTPALFVRNYRRDIIPKIKISQSKESLNSNKSEKQSPERIVEQKHHSSVKTLLRKSIRKIMPHQKAQAESPVSSTELQEPCEKRIDNEHKQCTLASHLMSSIRHSLRRKPKSHESKVVKIEPIPIAEISIIDTSERKMKLKSCASRNDYARIEELTNERKHLMRNGSIRRSMMKTLFHKQEEYTFQK